MPKALRSNTYVLAGGGTGGHIFPLLALAEILSLDNKQNKFVYAAVAGRIDEDILKLVDFDVVYQKIGQPAGLIGKISFLLALAYYVLLWLPTMRKASLLITTGGYGSVPAMVAGKLCRVPMIVYEPNAIDGKAARLGASWNNAHIVRPFSEKTPPLLRRSVLPANNLDIAQQRDALLVLGGSQGSLSLNKMFAQVAKELQKELQIKKIIWLTGQIGFDAIQAQFGNEDFVEIRAFSTDMQQLYNQTRLAVARAGAGSVFELAAWQIPAVYVPLPWSADGHQLGNATSAAAMGWGVVAEEKDGLQHFADTIRQQWRSPQKMSNVPTWDQAIAYWAGKGNIVDTFSKAAA